ncbi:MAG: prolipoprotein diacylglyceryl transferase [Planctomycetes bacterium]|nr:prolipoprotein diacylglyceryl transferase [Planctomycetota bacterium]
MHPVLYDFGFYKLHTYGLMLALAFLAALLFCRYEAKRIQVKPILMSDLLIWALGGGILGARLLYMIIHPDEYSGLLSFFAIWKGGLVYYGGFIGGVSGSYIFARRNKIRFIDLCDLVTPALMLGQAIGRWGCFMAGCCYGKEAASDFPLGVAFPADPDSLVPRALQNPDTANPQHFLHPIQLYLSANGIVLWLILWFILRKRKFRGQVTGFFLIFYAVSRSLLETFRGDVAERGFYGPLSTSQWVSVPMFILGIVLLVTCRRQHVPPITAESHSDED